MGRLAGWLLAAVGLFHATGAMPDASPALSAEEIVQKNVAARGGLEAWRKIETMSWIGHVETGTMTGSGLPFVLEMKRPNKTRFVLNAPQMMSMRVFDGTQGWKLRMTGSAPPDLEPYSANETAFALAGRVIDGALFGTLAHGTEVVLEGVDEIEKHKAYHLAVKSPSGTPHHVWIDVQSLLEIKSERAFRDATGRTENVTKFYRNYRDVDGLQIPFLVESSAGPGQYIDRMVIDTVVLNPPLEDRLFGKPNVPGGRQTRMTAGEAYRRMPGPPGMPRFAGFAGRGWSPRSGMSGSAHVQ